MTIFSNGYRVFSNEQDARDTILNWTKSSRDYVSRYSHVSEIKEKTKVERKGIRHTFYFYDWRNEGEKPSFNSYSYLERNIED
jgi:hypothetical protein